MIAGPDVTGSQGDQAFAGPMTGSRDDVRSMDDEVGEFLAQGFVVEETRDTFVTLRRPRRFSWRRCALLLGVFYLPYYMRQRDEVIHLHRDIDGHVYKLG